jgi:hypothetical protein
VLPYVVSLLAWFLFARGVDTLQSVPGMSGAGTMFAILDMMKPGALAFAFPFLLECWHVRVEWAAEVRQIAYDCCEEALERHLR